MSHPSHLIIKRFFDQLGQFDEFDIDIQNVKATIGHVYISVFTNAEGTVYANDNLGLPIENRLVTYTRYTLPYTDLLNNLIVGKMRIFFKNGTYFEIGNDNETGFWYSIQGLVPYAVNQLT